MAPTTCFFGPFLGSRPSSTTVKQPPACHAELPEAKAYSGASHGSAADFVKAVAAGESVVVDITASWCGPCKMMTQELMAVEQQFEGRVKVFTLELEENKALASLLKVRMLPTVLLFKGSAVEPLETFKGVVRRDVLSKAIEAKLLAPA